MAQNLISQTMTDAQRDAMLADLTAFNTKWAPYSVALTPEEIGKLAKISAADIAVLELALTFAQQNSGAIPGDVNVTEFASDIALAKQIVPMDASAKQKADKTTTSLIAVLSDAYKAALLIYNIAKAQGRTPQNQTFLDTFGQRFARGSQAPPPPNP
jgi:hypothetical protein